MGTTDEGLIQETFARFKIGFIFSETWFVKKKIQLTMKKIIYFNWNTIISYN